MADINYLYYGDLQVDLLALLNKMANEVTSYVLKLPWTRKRKEMFMSAYSDIINGGLKGASNSSGQWTIDFDGPSIDLNTKSKKDQEMYGEAAYFIQQLMNGLASKIQSDKENLPVYNGEEFKKGFHKYVNDKLSGGFNLNIGGEDDQWNYLDERDPLTGLRGRKNRATKLSELLLEYAATVDPSKYNFEESPFNSIENFRERINAASKALTETPDDLNDDNLTLAALGLKPSDWFNNGSGDTYVDEYGRTFVGSDGKPMNYNQYYNAKALQEKTKLETEQKAAELKQQALDALQIYTTAPITRKYSLEDLANKYGGNIDNFVSQYKGRNISSLTQDENDELVSLFLNGLELEALSGLSDAEWDIVKSKLGLDDSGRDLYTKIDGLDGIYYNTNTNEIFQIGNNSTLKGNNNFFKGLTSTEKLNAYLNSKIPGLTNAEWLELGSIGLDIASIIDPEPFTAAGFGIGAAGLRHNAKNNTPGHKWGFWEGVGLGVDYATGAIAAIPILGDAGLGIKIAANSGKWLPLITKALRLMARAGATTDVLSSASPATKAVYNKIVNGEDLTVGDWREVATLVRGLTGHGMLNRSNRAARKVLEESGFLTTTANVKENIVTKELAREGFFSSKIKGELIVPTLKLKKVGEDGKVETKEIDISPENKNKLEEAFSKSKPEERTAKAKEILKEEMPEGYEVETNTGWWRRLAEKIPYVPKKTKDSFGTSLKTVEKGADKFNTWLNDRGILSKMYYGWNPYMRRLRSQLGNPKLNGENTEGSNEDITRDFTPENFNAKDPKINPEFYHHPAIKDPNPPQISELREGMRLWRENNKGLFSANKLLSGEYNLGGSKLLVVEQTDGSFNIIFKGNHIGNYSNLKDLLKQIFSIIKKQRRPDLSKPAKISHKEIAKTLKELKRKGWLKLGGKITDTQIDNFLKQYKI